MSALLGDDVKQLKMEYEKSYSSQKGVNVKESQRRSQATELKNDSQENVTGTKRPHLAKTARKEGSQKEITTNKTTNINDNVQENGAKMLATYLPTRFRERSSSMMKNDKKIKHRWAQLSPGKKPKQNQNVFNGHYTVGQNANGKVSGKYCVLYDKPQSSIFILTFLLQPCLHSTHSLQLFSFNPWCVISVQLFFTK